MSSFLTRADALKAYLSRVVGLESMTIEVERPKNLPSEFIKATKKKKGLGMITWNGARNNDRNAYPLRLTCSYNISLIVKPSLRGSAPPLDDLAELAAQAIHHWSPNPSSPTAHQTRFEVLDVDKVEEGEVAAVMIVAESVVQLPKIEITLTP